MNKKLFVLVPLFVLMISTEAMARQRTVDPSLGDRSANSNSTSVNPGQMVAPSQAGGAVKISTPASARNPSSSDADCPTLVDQYKKATKDYIDAKGKTKTNKDGSRMIASTPAEKEALNSMHARLTQMHKNLEQKCKKNK